MNVYVDLKQYGDNMTAEDSLILKNISKSFSGNRVLNEVTLSIRAGEVHALIGENGAGKSTLMKILMGIYNADAGEIVLNGRSVTISSPRQALDMGIQMIHQELSPVSDMTVAENVFIGAEIKRAAFGFMPLVNKREMESQAEKLTAKVGLNIAPNTRMGNLSVAQMQMVEIAKAIRSNAKFIVMDEPTSALTEKETNILFDNIRALKAQGVSIIYISHKLEEIFAVCDRISILRDGKLIETVETKAVDRDYLIAKMVGRDIKNIYPKREAAIGDVLMEFKNICWSNRVKNVSFSVRKGEILGVAGLVGSGRSETMSAIFGVLPKDKGEVLHEGRVADIKKPADAVAQGMAYLTEDRKITGLNLIASIKHNISSVYLKRFLRRRLLHDPSECKVADHFIKLMKIRTDSRDKQVQLLSGGNQQKVALAKWLAGSPDIIILDEPTRGIDIGSKHDIYQLIAQLAEQGKAVIMVSSELPEVMGMSDRIMVMAEGVVTGFVDRADFDEERILAMQFV